MNDHPSKKLRGLNRNVFFAGVVSFFMDFSSEMVYPLVPLFLSSVLGVQMSVIGLIEGIAETTASLLKVFSGWLSDRLKHRKGLMVVGYGVSTLSRPLMATALNWVQVLSARFIDRFGKGIRNAPRDALIAESSQASYLGRAFGFHRAMDTLGAVAGPAVASVILALYAGHYRLVFWLSMIPGLLAVLTIVCFIREAGTSPVSRTAPPHLSWRSFGWQYKSFILTATLFSLGNSSDVFLILRSQHVGMPVAAIPLAYVVFNVVYGLGALPAGILSDRIGPKRIIFLSFLLFGVVYLGFALATGPGYVWLLFALYGVFMAMNEGVQKAFLATIIPSEYKATGFGLYHTMVGVAVLPASIIAGFLWDRVGPSAPFIYGAVAAWLAALSFIPLMVNPWRLQT